jgi:hypothetical protein
VAAGEATDGWESEYCRSVAALCSSSLGKVCRRLGEYLDQAAPLYTMAIVCRWDLEQDGGYYHLRDLCPKEGSYRHGCQVESRVKSSHV